MKPKFKLGNMLLTKSGGVGLVDLITIKKGITKEGVLSCEILYDIGGSIYFESDIVSAFREIKSREKKIRKTRGRGKKNVVASGADTGTGMDE